jgi:cytochrome c oxidase cbb3-type subunit III
MRSKLYWIGLGVLVLAAAATQLEARRSAAEATSAREAPEPAQGRGGRGRGGGQGAPTSGFPQTLRPAGDPALISRGEMLYEINCSACHGVDLRGGELGGSNLLRSDIMLNDQSGELLRPVVRDGLRNPGMPEMAPVDLSDDDIEAVAEYIHSILATARGQGGPPPGPPVALNVLVGDAVRGRLYFEQKCVGCHSATGDLRGIGSRMMDPAQLQNTWVGGGRGFGRGGGGGGNRVTATVTLPSGQVIEGPVIRVDDFLVALELPDGTSRSFRRDGNVPDVEIRNPMQGHLDLLPTYTDDDIHDVTAYLGTLQ